MHDLESYASGQPGVYDLVDPRTMTCINAEMAEGLKYVGWGGVVKFILRTQLRDLQFTQNYDHFQ